jgi:hypothetical protein
MESGLFTIFQWNGKDLFLQSVDDPDRFAFLSHQELTEAFRQAIAQGRKVHTSADGKITMLPNRSPSPSPSQSQSPSPIPNADSVSISASGVVNAKRMIRLTPFGPVEFWAIDHCKHV